MCVRGAVEQVGENDTGRYFARRCPLLLGSPKH